jgi:hypothetical protein
LHIGCGKADELGIVIDSWEVDSGRLEVEEGVEVKQRSSE